MRYHEIVGGRCLIEAETMHSFDPTAVTEVLSSRYINRGLKVSKNARFWRGISDDQSGMAVYGLGLYTTTSREKAKKFGRVVEMSATDLPDNPLRFATVNDFQIWYGDATKKLGYASKLDIGKQFPDFSDFIKALDPSIDGIQIGSGNDSIFVLYGEINLAEESLELPDIETGDKILIGKFKNRKAEVTGFKKDDKGQPVLKTTKGDQKLFKPRIAKLIPDK